MPPKNFIDWITTVEQTFDFKDIPKNRKVKIVAIKLRKHTSIWWEHLKRQRQHEVKDCIVTWEKMKRELRRKYFPNHYKQDAFMKFNNFKQKELAMEEYKSEFDHLMIRCDIVEPGEQMIACYVGGLHAELNDVVQLQSCWTYNDVCKLAMKVEKQLKERQSRSGSTSKSVAISKTTTIKQPPRNESTLGPNRPNTSGTCCRCFKCQGLGHIAYNCTNRKIVSLVEEDVEIKDEDESALVLHEHVDFNEEVVYVNQRESLVPRSLKVAYLEDEWLRNNIFHTRCTSHRKFCDVIIDGGSCENVVATTMVEKLKLETENHHQPYKLQWLFRGNEVKVFYRVFRFPLR
ncbi:hypothetical protein ACJW30_11G095600 [Castanea mollissima]